MTTNSCLCPRCQSPIQLDALGGLCPKCLMQPAVDQPSVGGQETLSRYKAFRAPTPEELNDVIQDLQVYELLGQGGMGAVYLARQIKLDRKVALKILAPSLSADPGFRERFTREARTLAHLQHPNIITIYEIGEVSGELGDYCYLVMELIDGVNMRDALVSGGITPKQALQIVPKICDALQYAHDQGVVHRDIKPENILIGLNHEVKIADFGLAKMLDESHQNFTLTATQQVLGTRNYMAPEQIEKPLTVDHRADIYSLGVVFYELLTGELPLGRFSLPSEISSVNHDMDELILKTLEKEPKRRYQSASDVRSAVEAIDLDVESPLQTINGQPSYTKSTFDAVPRENVNSFAQTQHESNEAGMRRCSLPFRNDQVHGGLSQLHGIAHVYDQCLTIEFRVHRLGFSKSEKKTIHVNFSELSNTHLKPGMRSSILEIQAGSLECFDDIPGSSHGCLKMTIEKSHSRMADEFCVELKRKILASSAVANGQGRASRAASLSQIPFKIPHVHAGFCEAAGIAKVTDNELVVQFEIVDPVGLSSAPRTAVIPWNQILLAKWKDGIFNHKIEIQTDGMDGVAAIPNSTQGKFFIKVARRNRPELLVWLRLVFQKIGQPLPPELIESKSPDEQANLDQAIRLPSKALIVCQAVNGIIAAFSLSYIMMFNVVGPESWWAFPFEYLFALGVPSDPKVWFVFGVVGPVICSLVSILLYWLIQQRSHYAVTLLCTGFLVLPWHFGSVVSVFVGLWILAILLNSKHQSAYQRYS